MREIKCVILVYLFVVVKSGKSITQVKDEYTVLEDERRAAEQIESDKLNQTTEINQAETISKGIFYNSPKGSQPIAPYSYQQGDKENIFQSGYGSNHRQPDKMQDRFYLPSLGHRGHGVSYGGYSGSFFPGEYSGGYGPISSGGYGYSGSGGGYGYIGGSSGYGHNVHESFEPTEYEYEGPGHSHGGSGSSFGLSSLKNPLLLKKLLLPLAGIALLGAAAALSANPVLLQLGVVKGKRKRRSITQCINQPYWHQYKNGVVSMLHSRKNKREYNRPSLKH